MISNFLILAFLFSMGCILGWGLEVVYRRFKPDNKERKWINPGFLTGPYLPLYGFGLCMLYLLAGLEGSPLIHQVTIGSKLILFLVMAVFMTLLEYIAGLIFIKGMKIKLWDYTNEPFNIQGIICLRFSIYWALLGAFYYFLIHPRILEALEWFAQNITFSFVVGMFYGVFLVDLVYSLGIVTKVRRFAIDNQILVKYEELKREIRENAEEHREKVRFIFSFKSDVPLREHLSRYLDLQKAFDLDTKDILNELQESIQDTIENTKDAISDARDAISDAIEDTRDAISDAKDAIKDAMKKDGE